MTGIESQFKCQMITKLLNNAIDNHLHLQQKLFKEFKRYFTRQNVLHIFQKNLENNYNSFLQE